MEDEELIEEILEYASTRPKFDTDFVISVQDALSEYGSLTENQRAALEKIYNRYRIGEKKKPIPAWTEF